MSQNFFFFFFFFSFFKRHPTWLRHAELKVESKESLLFIKKLQEALLWEISVPASTKI